MKSQRITNIIAIHHEGAIYPVGVAGGAGAGGKDGGTAKSPCVSVPKLFDSC